MVMYMRDPLSLTDLQPRFTTSPAIGVVVACAAAGVVLLGLFPGPLLSLAAQAVPLLK
jgi:NADH-quinone oxidoreductase subunit N